MSGQHGGHREPGPGKKLGPPFNLDKGVQFRATLPKQLHKWLKEEAKRTGQSMSAITAAALEAYRAKPSS